MLRRHELATLALLFALASCSTSGVQPGNDRPDALLGTWKVDLRPTPSAEPYFQEFVVSDVSGSSFTATFYGTEVTQARINSDWGTLRIAFVTADGSGDYHHSAVLRDGMLEGLSNSTGRDFLAYWSAVKQ